MKWVKIIGLSLLAIAFVVLFNVEEMRPIERFGWLSSVGFLLALWVEGL